MVGCGGRRRRVERAAAATRVLRQRESREGVESERVERPERLITFFIYIKKRTTNKYNPFVPGFGKPGTNVWSFVPCFWVPGTNTYLYLTFPNVRFK